MRLAEYFLICTLFLSLIAKLLSNSKWPYFFVISSGIGIHFGLESLRWQMVPAYIASVLVLLFLLLEYTPSIFIRIILLLLLLFSSLLAYLLPVPTLPTFNKTDSTTTLAYSIHHISLEPYATHPFIKTRNTLACKIWYPAKRKEQYKTRLAPYFHYPSVIEYVVKHGLWVDIPAWAGSHLMLATSNCYPDTLDDILGPKSKSPVILFSHGVTGTPELYTVLCETLSNRGYIVVGIWHTDGTAACEVNQHGEVVHEYANITTELVHEEIIIRKEQLNRRLKDVEVVLNYLVQLNSNPNSKFYNMMDLNSVGIFGHSFGGATAAYACMELPTQIKCGLGLDSWVEAFPTLTNNSELFPPFMFLNSGLWQWPENLQIMKDIMNHSKSVAYQTTFHNTSHHNYNDLPLMAPWILKFASKFTHLFTGPLDGIYVFEVIADTLEVFFKHHLQDKSQQPFDTKTLSKFPELSFDIFGPNGNACPTNSLNTTQ